MISLAARFWVLALSLALPVVHLLAFGPHIPEGTFLLISLLDDVTAASDPSNIVYSFARPPVHLLLGWVFSHPWSLLLAGLLFHSIFNLVVFAIAYKATELSGLAQDAMSRVFVAALVTALVYPLAVVAGVAGSGTSLVPHDAYHQFSFRTVFVSLAGISYLLLLNRKPAFAFLTAGISCYIHPTAGFLLIGLLTLAAAPNLMRERKASVGAAWCMALALGALPMLTKLFFFEMPDSLSERVSYESWYSKMIKDEADDFSFLFQIAVYPLHTLRLVLAILIPLVVYMRVFPAYRSQLVFWHGLAIPFLFVSAAVLEFTFAALVPTALIYPLTALTPGYRLLSFAFFPLLVVGSQIVYAFALESRKRLSGIALSVTGVVLVFATCVSLLSAGAVNGHAVTSIRYAGWAWHANQVPGIDAYLEAVHSNGGSAYRAPEIKTFFGDVVTYPNERNIFSILELDREQPSAELDSKAMERLGYSEFYRLVQQIRVEIPEESGLVIPPYMRYFRDALPGHRVFFQEHHDGNLMLGSPAFLKFWTGRMHDLLGFSYEEMPSKYSGLSFTFMREAYLVGMRSTSRARRLDEPEKVGVLSDGTCR